MKEKTSSSSSKTDAGSKVSPFVNYDLTASDKAELQRLKPTAESCLKEVTALAKEGYKLTIGWDDYSDTLAVWLIGHSPSCANHGFILPSRANDLVKAIASVIYKHKAVFDGKWHDRTVGSNPTDDF